VKVRATKRFLTQRIETTGKQLDADVEHATKFVSIYVSVIKQMIVNLLTVQAISVLVELASACNTALHIDGHGGGSGDGRSRQQNMELRGDQ